VAAIKLKLSSLWVAVFALWNSFQSYRAPAAPLPGVSVTKREDHDQLHHPDDGRHSALKVETTPPMPFFNPQFVDTPAQARQHDDLVAHDIAVRSSTIFGTRNEALMMLHRNGAGRTPADDHDG
jgi:hypothetical protein